MNLFVLSANPTEAAEAHADKHVVKMILEACQMLYSAHWSAAYSGLLEQRSSIAISRFHKFLHIPPSMIDAPLCSTGESGYKPAHLHHPCTRWVRASRGNYEWASALAVAIGHEYTYRYGKEHACMEHAKWLSANLPDLPAEGLQPFAIAMMPEYKISDDAIECYHHYYKMSKGGRGLLQYTKRSPPEFLKSANIKHQP
jgi:hypothetical protein